MAYFPGFKNFSAVPQKRKGNRLARPFRAVFCMLLTVCVSFGIGVLPGMLSLPAVQAADCTNGCNVGDGLTATWDDTDKIITVRGAGTLHRDTWKYGVFEPYASRASKIVFEAVGGVISFPQDSSKLFSYDTFDSYKAVIELPSEIDTSQVTNMWAMFHGASMANPNVSNWDTGNVTNMGRMFYGASMADPNVSSWNTENVTNMEYMFVNTQKANPDVSNWNTESVTNMAGMFQAARIANPDVSGWDVSKVTDMSGMFSLAYSAKPDISDWNALAVTNTDYMFFSVPNIRFLDITGLATVQGNDFIYFGENQEVRLTATGRQVKTLAERGNASLSDTTYVVENPAMGRVT